MIPLNQNYKFENLNLREGEITRKDKAGQEITKRYRRDPQAQGGMAELVNIVAGLQKDVKRINQCLTLEGAKAYALKRKNWEASELDFTGPNGKPDGINEVIVTDANGNIKIINGYALAKSTYPQRKLYRTMYPTKEARKGHKYGEFIDQLYAINDELDENGEPYYVNSVESYGPQFAHIRPELKPKDVFKKFVFEPTYENVKEAIKNIFQPLGDKKGIAIAQVATKVLSRAYDDMVKKPILAKALNVQANQLDSIADKTKNKVLRSEQFTKDTYGLVGDMIREKEVLMELQQALDNEYFPAAIDEVAAKMGLEGELQHDFSNAPQIETPKRTPRKQGNFGQPSPA